MSCTLAGGGAGGGAEATSEGAGGTGLQWLALATAVLCTAGIGYKTVCWALKVCKLVAEGYKTVCWKLGAIQQHLENILQAQERATTAVVNLERRKMEATLGGAEASRLIAAALAEYIPYGSVDS